MKYTGIEQIDEAIDQQEVRLMNEHYEPKVLLLGSNTEQLLTAGSKAADPRIQAFLGSSETRINEYRGYPIMQDKKNPDQLLLLGGKAEA